VILEHVSGTWHGKLTVFLFVRHAGSTAGLAYAAQAVASLVVVVLVASCWRRRGAGPESSALFVLGLLAGALYVSDYDCVMVTLAAAWLWNRSSRAVQLALAAAVAMPLFAAVAANATHLALGMIVLWACFGTVAWQLLRAEKVPQASDGSPLRAGQVAAS
jgi:hypothetical protein